MFDGNLKIGKKWLVGISFMYDGKYVFVLLCDEQGIVVLNVDDGKVIDSGMCLSIGVVLYMIDVLSDNCWVVVSNVGFVGLFGYFGMFVGDVDLVVLIDVLCVLFCMVQYLMVLLLLEGVVILLNGKWIVVQVMDGLNLMVDNLGCYKFGKVLLFEICDGQVVKVSEVFGGEVVQGIVFIVDSWYVIVQFNVEWQFVLYVVDGGKLCDMGKWIVLIGGLFLLRMLLC